MVRRRVAVSVVSVWNDAAVLGACLDRSLRELRHTAPDTELVAVDNRGQRCTTAGSALNEGVRAATRDVVAFVQQDIYLHSLVALEEAAALLIDDPSLAMVGAVGIDSGGRVRGRIRDRVVLIGEVCQTSGAGRQPRRGALPGAPPGPAGRPAVGGALTWRGTRTRSSGDCAAPTRAARWQPSTSR